MHASSLRISPLRLRLGKLIALRPVTVGPKTETHTCLFPSQTSNPRHSPIYLERDPGSEETLTDKVWSRALEKVKFEKFILNMLRRGTRCCRDIPRLSLRPHIKQI